MDPQSHVPPPTPESLAHRARIARLVSPLKPIRARVPFWQLAAHRIPTLWTLYRGLLRESPTPLIRWRISMLFRTNEHLTSLRSTKAELLKGYKWLDAFSKANRGDTNIQAILRRYDAMIRVKREKEYWKALFVEEAAWQQKLRSRPVITGHMRASVFNKPLPRLKPQPVSISLMLRKRRIARERRQAKNLEITAFREDLRQEATFENLAYEYERKLKRVEGGNDGMVKAPEERVFDKRNIEEWDAELLKLQKSIAATFKLEEARRTAPWPPELVEQIMAARKRIAMHKRLQGERERRGEVFPRTIRCRNKAPPAHVLARMSPAQRKMDRVARGVSEVGYVAAVKKRLGWKLKDDETWKKEDAIGPEGKKVEEEIRQELQRRRSDQRNADHSDGGWVCWTRKHMQRTRQ